MAEASIAVALLFDDVELGGQLREALRERGARIVHEGALSTLSQSLLDNTGAQVLVVNLDEEAEDDLDRLYDVIDGDYPRVVFNDAQASRQLDGWDRARWARHLAVKVMAQGDLDPPRPQDAPSVPETVVSEVVPVEVEALEPIAELVSDIEPMTDFSEIPAEPAAVLEGGEVSEVSETLAAELEALLAADEPQALEDDFGSLKFVADDELPPLHDGHFGVDNLATQGPAPVEPEPPALPPRVMPSFQLDHLSLSPLDDSFLPSATGESVEKGPSSLLALASSWSLVDEEEASVVVAAAEPVEFGIEKLSAADFLAPDGGNEDESFLKPGMTLELVSIEEAIAPKAYEGGHEMVLADLDAAISRVLVIGAASDSTDAVCSFLSRLPMDLRATVLHVQHMGGKSAESLVDHMAGHCGLPVNVASHGARARMGEVLVVPAGHQARVQRDGRVELQPLDGQEGLGSSPIDASFTMAANVFGRNALAIVFAGQANDALGGSQAIYDRGGQVWVEASEESHFPDMVHGIEAERLNSYSGTPAELAARLVEEMSMEGRR